MGRIKDAILDRVKSWLGVPELVARIDSQNTRIANLSRTLNDKITELDELTREDWDVGARGPSTIILTGIYRGRGYVKFYEVSGDQFHSLVEEYQHRRKHGGVLVRNIDAPYRMMDGSFDAF